MRNIKANSIWPHPKEWDRCHEKMIVYKLVRKLKNGDLKPLFINRTQALPLNEWLKAECHPTKGFAVREGWHCTSKPIAPHLSEKGRVWVKVEIRGCEEFQRPQNQGGMWFIAKWMKIIKEMK